MLLAQSSVDTGKSNKLADCKLDALNILDLEWM